MSVTVTIVDDNNVTVSVAEEVINVSVDNAPGPQGPQGPQGIPGEPGEGGVWGSITGTLGDQTDLQSALDLKANTSALASYQATSAMSNYLGTSYTTHTHDYIPTANSTYFLDTGYSSHTHSQYLNTSQSSLFQSTGNYLTTAMQSGASTQFDWVIISLWG